MTPHPDASRAAVTVAAQRIAAYADNQHIAITPAQCEELAEDLVHAYQEFFATAQHASAPADPALGT